MAKLEDITVGSTILGIAADEPVTIVATKWYSGNALEVIYKKSLLAQCCCSTPYGTRLLGTWHRLIGKINSRRVPDLAI